MGMEAEQQSLGGSEGERDLGFRAHVVYTTEGIGQHRVASAHSCRTCSVRFSTAVQLLYRGASSREGADTNVRYITAQPSRQRLQTRSVLVVCWRWVVCSVAGLMRGTRSGKNF
jgi:hypothetical protein